jgi:hypothetical protein
MRRGMLFTLAASMTEALLSGTPSMELTKYQYHQTVQSSLNSVSYNQSTPGSSGGGSGGNDCVCSQAGLPGGASATLSNGELTLF